MTSTMAGLPFWQLTFDADGDQDAGERDRFLTELRDGPVTDLLVLAHGWNNVQAVLDPLRPAAPGTSYRFAAGQALNIDASEIVRAGGPPSGAHSDIVHPELTWVVLLAGGLTT
jgi:hypothetical protein